jgi:hypothetical protein
VLLPAAASTAAAAAAVKAEQRRAAASPRRIGGGGGGSSSAAAGKRITAADLFKPASVHGARPPARGSPSREAAPGRRRASAPYRTAAAAAASADVDADASEAAVAAPAAAAEVCAPLDWPAQMFKGGPGSSSGEGTCGASSAFSRSEEGAAGGDRAILFREVSCKHFVHVLVLARDDMNTMLQVVHRVQQRFALCRIAASFMGAFASSRYCRLCSVCY